MRGGYQIIDLENHDFSNAVTHYIEGIYEKIESTRKPIYVTNLVYEGVEMHDAYVDFKVVNSNYEGVIHGVKITIGNNADALDSVTITTI